MPARLKSGIPYMVSPDAWLLFGLEQQDQLLMALHVHAVYSLHNMYRHIPDRGEFRQSIQRAVLEIPLSAKWRQFVSSAMQDICPQPRRTCFRPQKGKRKYDTHVANILYCTIGHELGALVDQVSYMCALCQSTIPPGQVVMTCRQCRYYACQACL